MISKKVLEKELQNFPDHFTIDELVGKLIVLEKRQREHTYINGLGAIPVKELDTEIEKWFKM
ncbi:hypothetical protein [Mesonia aestuariivivens]|uniref:Uncharacterized protein n=1 Tax=Mesonia aestuariivivens TaxID=2796128 RepID=A0ABS6W3W8_9FLAO|nr:hypothetical protein [Mesonia aestuariivivens]MBW2962514.1 hypothetical protein [Mesonia aestuariivivens]